MLSITRSQFREAIFAGIQAVTPGTPESQRVRYDGPPLPTQVLSRLMEMAEADTEFGTNFCSEPCACPMGRLGYYDEEKARTTQPWAMPFAEGFDHVWVKYVPQDWYTHGDVIRVVNEPR